MATPTGFWSYVHADDDAEGGRIVKLAHDVVARYQMVTGEEIDLFLDRDSLEWGDAWRSKVDEALTGVAFFIPVITPRFFQSAECRRELNFFARKATQLGIRELVMPILYVDVPALHVEPITDDAMQLVKTFQWEDWTDLSFEDPDSSAYRRGVAKLAERLASASRSAELVDVTAQVVDLDEDDAPGLIDRVAAMEDTLPLWQETLTEITRELERVGEIVSGSAEEIERGNEQGKAFAARLTVARKLAGELSDPANRIQQLGGEFTSQLNDVDSGIRALIERAPEEMDSEEDRTTVCTFFESLREMAASAEDGLGAAEQMVGAVQGVEGLSRDMRPPLRKMRAGLTMMAEGRSVIREWVSLMDASGLDC